MTDHDAARITRIDLQDRVTVLEDKIAWHETERAVLLARVAHLEARLRKTVLLVECERNLAPDEEGYEPCGGTINQGTCDRCGSMSLFAEPTEP